MRSIPGSGERVPAVGLGTARIFDRDDETTRGKAAAVIQALVANGGRIVDTASTYGDAELVVGVEMANAGLRDEDFHRDQAREFRRCRAQAFADSPEDHKGRLAAIAQRRETQSIAGQIQGVEGAGDMPLCRHHIDCFHRDFPAVEAVLRREKPDFVQIDYSLDVRDAESTFSRRRRTSKQVC